MKQSFLKSLRTTSIICLIAAIIVLSIGIYKITAYENSDSYWGDHVNVYVGGDAYNYIINGTYFSGYMALGGALLVCSTVAKGAGIICALLPEGNSSVQAQDNTDYIEVSDLPEI